MADNQSDNKQRVINYRSIRTVLENHESVSQEEIKEATQDPNKQAAMIAGINNAMREIEAFETSPDVLSSPPNQMGALLQSFLEERAEEEGKPILRDLPGNALEVKFDPKDWLGWAGSFFSWASGIVKHDWQTASLDPEPIPSRIRMALLADWGTGLYGAPDCAKCISLDKDSYTHVLHLGDVYYAGTKKEVARRFLALWPKLKAVSRACNSNHEMYSGGHAYFDDTLAAFNQRASYFAFENSNWILVGLDTAYREHNLDDEQLGWLSLILKKRPEKKLVLFSHHQPYSMLDHQGPNLISYLRQLLEEKRIHAWYWGHEHRCVVYDRHPAWGLAGRCVGHGGYPYFRDINSFDPNEKHNGDNGSTWYRFRAKSLTQDESHVPGGLIVPDALVLDGPNPYMDNEADKYGPNGYLTLEFEGDRMFETFQEPQKNQSIPRTVINRREV